MRFREDRIIDRRIIRVGERESAYWEAGAGETILYIHGFPTSGYLWRNVASVTASAFHPIACDLPGFGDSDLLAGPHTWEALVDWIEAFVDTCGFETLHLGVHDWGGLIGLAWAAKNPARVRSLFITDTTFRSKDRWHELARQWREPGVGEKIFDSITREGLEGMLSPLSQMGDDSFDEYFKGLATPERRAAKLEMYRSLDFEMLAPLEPLLPAAAPGAVRIVWGSADPFLPVSGAFRMGADLDADVTVLEGAGHFLQEDRGEDVGRLHLEFLRSL